MKWRIFVTLLLLTAVAVLPALPAGAEGQAGTTLSAEKMAAGYWNKYFTYDWTVLKTVNPTSIEITGGSCGTVTYTVNVTRTLVSEQDVYGVSGQICVTNGGAATTENLTIVDQVEYKTGPGQFQDLPGASQTITPAQLAPGATGCYDYNIAFTPVAGAQYRNVAHVTITNHSGWLPGGPHCAGPEPCPFGPDPKADFSLPGTPNIIETDESATVADAEVCPAGFACTPSDYGPWTFNATGSVSFTKQICNTTAMCDTYYDLPNTVTLTEGDTGQTSTSSANVSIYTGICQGGCTLTIGFWKTHAGFTGRNPDRVTQYLPIWLGTAGGTKSVQVANAQFAVQVLSMNLGAPSNGITKLYAQLLAAKLNIASGADGSAVASTIAAADDFLATYDYTAWASLSKAQQKMVLGWMSTLDSYNNGYIGPGHCD